MDGGPFTTQHDAGLAVAVQLGAAGFDDAEEVGRGGFGVVYRCTQVALDRVVAVKVLTAELEENRERFLREQRAMGRLTGHPNIVGVLQVGETASGYPYLVMQYHGHGSLEARIGESGPLSVTEVLRLGVKMAGALESAHRLGIVHRDVKPGNILLTDFGEPALTDFGIAHLSEGFTTATGIFTGSPAFMAPEIISGEPPSPASDVYGLGATLFCALTGHPAFKRRSGEQVVAQLVRITKESPPDLREQGIPADVAALIETAMARDPLQRPSALALGEQIGQVQAARGWAVDAMALRGQPPPERAERAERHTSVTATAGSTLGNLPWELTSFVGRRSELSQVTSALSTSRLVTLTGVGGVGKTRLALRAATEARPDFADGVWFADLSEVRDESLVVEVVASTFGLRNESGGPLQEALVDFLSTRELLLVLDNCEQVIEAVAKLAETSLRACAELRILATSREALGIGGETVLPISPLGCPDADAEPTRGGLPDSDALELFAARAAATVHGFALTDANKATVARICSRLDGLPLAIELAAARLRVMSPEQILERLADRYALLTHASRGAPTRQQTLRWSIGWSYDLCTAAEQQLWGRLSVFAGSFELEAAEGICGEDLEPGQLLDLVSSLVEKSILIRAESKGVVRFRFLETVREYGRQQIIKTGEYSELRRRHRDWYQRLVQSAWSEWSSSRQAYWIERVEREMVNIREALDFGLSDSADVALGIAARLYPFWIADGRLSEGRRWLDRVLAATPPEPTVDRVSALYGATAIAGVQGDLPAATARVAEAAPLIEQTTNPLAHGLFGVADGFASLLCGEFDRACARLEDAVGASDDPIVQLPAMTCLGWVLEFRGDGAGALAWYERALAIAESHGELVYRTYALWAMGVANWREGDADRAIALLTQCLRMAQQVNDPRTVATCIEALAWMADDPARAVVMMAAAEALGVAVGSSTMVFPNLAVHHEECERRNREALGDKEFNAAHQQGSGMKFADAVAYALPG